MYSIGKDAAAAGCVGGCGASMVRLTDESLLPMTQPHSSSETLVPAACASSRRSWLRQSAALLGALPLMVGWGMGAELRRPLGVTMVGGLIFSQALTLFTTPVIYLWFDRVAVRVRGRGGVVEGVGHA